MTWAKHESYDSWLKQVQDPRRVFYFSTKAKKSYFDIEYQPGDIFMFGKETKGLPEEILHKNEDQIVKIPQFGQVRSLNLATAVAIALYEGIRQIRAKGLIQEK